MSQITFIRNSFQTLQASRGEVVRGCCTNTLLTHGYTHLREMWMLKRLQGSKAVPSNGRERYGTCPDRE